MTPEQVAYIAGIIDGEGHIAISKRPPNRKSGEISSTYQIYLKVGSTDPRLVEWLRDTTGEGTIYEESVRNDRTRRRFWTWHLPPVPCVTLLRKVYPYLVIKKFQAECIFGIRETYKGFNPKIKSPEILEARERFWKMLASNHQRQFIHSSEADLP